MVNNSIGKCGFNAYELSDTSLRNWMVSCMGFAISAAFGR